MSIKVGPEFEIETIISTETKCIGGTTKTWGLLGRNGSGTGVQVTDEWHRAWRPKIGGWVVNRYDPSNPGQPAWLEYETPTKHEKSLQVRTKKANKASLRHR